MFLDFLTPEVFDAIIIMNIVLGLMIAARRFRQDISAPLPEDAPASARAACHSSLSSSTPSSDS